MTQSSFNKSNATRNKMINYSAHKLNIASIATIQHKLQLQSSLRISPTDIPICRSSKQYFNQVVAMFLVISNSERYIKKMDLKNIKAKFMIDK